MRKIKVAAGVLLAAFSLDAVVFNVREFGAKGDKMTAHLLCWDFD